MRRNSEHVLIFEIQKNRVLKWKKWCRLLATTYRAEVEKSLREEVIEHEMFVTFELNGATYGLAHMRGVCLPSNGAREVNAIHYRKVQECLRRVSQGSVLYSVRL